MRLSPRRNKGQPKDGGGTPSGNHQSKGPSEDTLTPTPRRTLSVVGKLSHAASTLFLKSTVAIDIEGHFIRVVAVRGRQVIAWGTAICADEEHSQGMDQADQLRVLLQQLPINRRRRLITSLPIHSSLMRTFEMPTMRRKYIEPVIHSEVIETIPFAVDEADIAWHYRHVVAGHEAYVTAVSKDTIDRHVNMLKTGRGKPVAAYSKAAALAFAIGLQDVVVVDLNLDSASIVLVKEWIPTVIRQVNLVDMEAAVEKRAEALAMAIEQVVSSEKRLGDVAEIPVTTTGYLSGDEKLIEALKETLSFQLIENTPALQFPEHFPAREYASPLGLVIADKRRAKPGRKLSGRKAASINLLPERHLPRPMPVVPAAIFFILLLFSYVAFGITNQVNAVESENATRLAQVTRLENQARINRILLAQEAATTNRVQALIQERAATESSLAIFENSNAELLARLETTTTTARASDVQVSDITLRPEGFLLAGRASSFSGLFQYTSGLRDSDVFENVKILRVETSGGEGLLGPGENGRAGLLTFQATAPFRSTR